MPLQGCLLPLQSGRPGEILKLLYDKKSAVLFLSNIPPEVKEDTQILLFYFFFGPIGLKAGAEGPMWHTVSRATRRKHDF
jgi:hypothetical protein